MADVRVASTGDGVPLLDPDGGGVYNVGRNNSHDIRFGLLSTLYGSASTSFTCRPGVLPRSFSAGSISSLMVTQNGTPNRFVNIAPGIGIHTRTGEGPYPGYNPITVNLQASAANATNPRVDLVVSRMYDKGPFPADPFHAHYIEIIEGLAAASPTVPATPDGAIALARLNRETTAGGGDTITTAKIQDLRKGAHLAGTPRLLFPGDSAADGGVVPGEQRYRIVSSVLQPMEYWGADSLWHGTVTQAYDITSFDNASSTVSKVVASVTIPDPGWPYKVRARGALIWTQGINTVFDVGIRQTNASGADWGQTPGFANGAGGLAPDIYRQVDASNGTGTLTGSTTVCLCLIRTGGSDAGSGANAQASGYNKFSVDVIPV